MHCCRHALRRRTSKVLRRSNEDCRQHVNCVEAISRLNAHMCNKNHRNGTTYVPHAHSYNEGGEGHQPTNPSPNPSVAELQVRCHSGRCYYIEGSSSNSHRIDTCQSTSAVFGLLASHKEALGETRPNCSLVSDTPHSAWPSVWGLCLTGE